MPIALSLALAAPAPSAWSGTRTPSVPLSRDASVGRWLATDGRVLAIGHGRRLSIQDRATSRFREIVLDAPGVSGALFGRRLLILDDDGGLLHIDLEEPEAGVNRLASDRGDRATSLAVSRGDTLIIADQGRGLMLLRIPSFPHGGHQGALAGRHETIALAPAGFIAIEDRVTALAAQDDRIVLGSEDGSLRIIEEIGSGAGSVSDRATASWRRIALGEPVLSLALASRRIYALGPSGLWRVDLGDEDPGDPVHVAPIAGVALAVAGREVSILGEDGALSRIIDHEPAALMHTVSVQNNYFTPASMTVFPGDTVRWSNSSAGFHNVVSCIAGQSGCELDATESFHSGFPSTIWFFTHAFQQPGSNPYICEPHATQMIGEVIVAAPPAPPPVPDGRDGSPMTVIPLDPGATTLSIAWDDVSCGSASSHHLIWGHRSHLPAAPGGAFSFAGAVCGIATPFVWTDSPDPAAVPKRIVWWLILPGEGATEGSWGIDSQGAERNGPAVGGSSGSCGIVSKDVSAGCNP